MNINILRELADFAMCQPDGHQQPPLPSWSTIDELIKERDSLLAVAKAAKICDDYNMQVCQGDVNWLDFPGEKEMHEALQALPTHIKAEIEKRG